MFTISYHDGLRWVGAADIHQDVVVLLKVDARLIVGKYGVLVFRHGRGNIRDLGSCGSEQEFCCATPNKN